MQGEGKEQGCDIGSVAFSSHKPWQIEQTGKISVGLFLKNSNQIQGKHNFKV